MLAFRYRLSLGLLLLALVGCRFPGAPALGPERPAAISQSTVSQCHALSGRVSFQMRSAQVLTSDVTSASTVSLIDTGTNNTVAATVTDSSGQFNLTFPSSFTPDPTVAYYLEAVKGLGNNMPGNAAARVRTIAMYSNAGWTTITNFTPNVGIIVNPSTTALSIGAALRNGNPSPFSFSSLIGKIAVGSPDTYTPLTGLSSDDYAALVALVMDSLKADRDPVGSISLNAANGAWNAVTLPIITSITPNSGAVGTTLSIYGTGFSTTAASYSLRFNGVPAIVTSATGTSLTATVPAGATSGPCTLQVGNQVHAGPLFTVPVVVNSFNPASGSMGTIVTLTGSGFDAGTSTNNLVSFGGQPARVTAASATSLTAVVPDGATSGPVSVTVLGSALSTGSFTVPVTVKGFLPTSGQVGSTLTIFGSGFGSTPASNSVSIGGVAVTVTGATPTSLSVTIPSNASGSIAVTVAGQTGTGSGTFTSWSGIGPNAVISTVAGNGTFGFGGDGGVATSANLNGPTAVVMDASGNLYITDSNNHRIRKVTPAGVISTVAGTGTGGYSGDGGAATSAFLSDPMGMALDATGNLYIADLGNNCIRKMTPAGVISTVAGDGTFGFGGDGGNATSASLKVPFGVTLDASGNLYITDSGNHRIRKVDTAGVISTVAGNGAANYWGDGGAASSANLNYPHGVALDASGNLYIADSNNHRIRKVTSAGVISTVAGTGTAGYSGDGGAATSANLNDPHGVALDASGNLYITDRNNHRIRKVNTAGVISTVAGNGTFGFSGDGGAATSASLNSPHGVTLDASGNLYLTGNHRIRKLSNP